MYQLSSRVQIYHPQLVSVSPLTEHFTELNSSGFEHMTVSIFAAWDELQLKDGAAENNQCVQLYDIVHQLNILCPPETVNT